LLRAAESKSSQFPLFIGEHSASEIENAFGIEAHRC
jgi:hypothetical protein